MIPLQYACLCLDCESVFDQRNPENNTQLLREVSPCCANNKWVAVITFLNREGTERAPRP